MWCPVCCDACVSPQPFALFKVVRWGFGWGKITTQNLLIRSSNPLVGCAALGSRLDPNHQSGSQMMKIQRNAQKGGILGLKWVSGRAPVRGFHIRKLAFSGLPQSGKGFPSTLNSSRVSRKARALSGGRSKNCLLGTPRGHLRDSNTWPQ